jgi:hypothetical protein
MEHKLKETLRYILETLGVQATVTPLAKSHLDRCGLAPH